MIGSPLTRAAKNRSKYSTTGPPGSEMIRTVALAGTTEIPAAATPMNTIRPVWRIFQSSRRLEGNNRASARDRERPDRERCPPQPAVRVRDVVTKAST
jgi:hypothetical protein